MTQDPALQTWITSCGTRLTLRPVQRFDGPALAHMIERLSARSRRWRFHAGVKATSPAWIERLTQAASARQQALVVVTETGMVVAEGRWARASDGGDAAEFAIVVADAWQRLGIGRRLMRALAATAQAAGVRWLHGEVLHDNGPMCRLMRGLRFERRVPALPEDTGCLLRFELAVAQLLPASPAAGLRAWLARLTRALGGLNPWPLGADWRVE
ncbi:MAG: GNAT family N-acetyltransferase [Rubrivivax sp.]